MNMVWHNREFHQRDAIVPCDCRNESEKYKIVLGRVKDDSPVKGADVDVMRYTRKEFLRMLCFEVFHLPNLRIKIRIWKAGS